MSGLDALKRRVIDEVDGLRDELIRIADTIHAHPELAFQEHEASALLSGTLEAKGFALERGVAGLETAFVASQRGLGGSPRVAFLAEYDALPELGHACGHNLIGAAAVGAGLAMQVVLPELEGVIYVIGTPAEEQHGGKAIMAEAGVFDGLDAAMMVHPSSRNMTRRKSLTSHRVNIEFFGKAAHSAASPDMGINALDALVLTFNGVNALRQHLRDDARVHGIITHGGSAPNVVPDYAAGSFGVRAADMRYAAEVLEKVRACAEAGARAAGARLEFTELGLSYDAMMPNPVIADLADANMAQLGVEVREPGPDERMGSTDMGNVSAVVPAIHAYISVGPDELTVHSVEFREVSASPAGHAGMIQAAKLMAMTAVDLLAEPDNVRRIRRAFEDQTGRQPEEGD
jgi:amidohydrolase